MVSHNETLGVLMEMKGKGCRQMESYLLAQERSWYDFMLNCLTSGGVVKRLDLAINDRVGILNIPKLIEKWERGEAVSRFRGEKDYKGTQKNGDDIPESTGNTLYIGSTKSELYFCLYEKDHEQHHKNGTDMETAEIKNRFEIRLKNERAYHAVVDMLTYYDVERTAFIDKALLNVKEVSKYLGIGETKARELLHNPRNGFTVRIGNRLYAHKGKLDIRLKNQTVQ